MTAILFCAVLLFAGFVAGYYFAYKNYAKDLAEQQKTIVKLYEELEAWQ